MPVRSQFKMVLRAAVRDPCPSQMLRDVSSWFRLRFCFWIATCLLRDPYDEIVHDYVCFVGHLFGSSSRTQPSRAAIPRILVKDEVVSTRGYDRDHSAARRGERESYLCEATAAAHGEFSLSGCELTYTPGENSTESESLTYVAIDSKGKEVKSASIWITVDPVNDAPTAVSLDLSTDENTSVSVALSGMDVERSALTYSLVRPRMALTGTRRHWFMFPARISAGPTHSRIPLATGKPIRPRLRLPFRS